MLKLRGLRLRWMVNGIILVTAIIIVSVIGVSLTASSYCYASMQAGLEVKAKTASEFFTTYVTRTYADYYQSAYRYTESFDEKDKLELQFINTRGKVEVSSYGITAGTLPDTFDIKTAIETGEISAWTGKRTDTGERIMAVSSPLLHSDGQVIGVMRYVTSLRLADRFVFRISLLASLIGLLILSLVVLSNLYFLNTITGPIRELTVTARSIAEGSYGVQTPKKYDDEIGDLTDAINEMSLKISQAETVQSEFISSVSHELRTPLTAITGWSETLLYDEEIRGDSRRGLDIIAKEASRLTKMVEELLEFTRIQDGRFTLSVQQIDISAELEESIYAYRELLSKEGITLVIEPCPVQLPPVSGDPERLRQVFLNILDNAAKYGREGGKIVVTLSRDDDWVSVGIRDFGQGIPTAELPYVKRKFYKGSAKGRGSGIGLAVCDEIILRHNGTLKIQNAEGGGVLVTVKLPCR